MEDILLNPTTIEEAIKLGYHVLVNPDNIIQCVRCNAFCLSDTIQNIPIVSNITKEIICNDCYTNLFKQLTFYFNY